jgi:hypothetical protein
MDARTSLAPRAATVLVRSGARRGQPLRNPDELLDTATRIGGRYVGAERGQEFGKRNGVPGELVVRVKPIKVIAAFDIAG